MAKSKYDPQDRRYGLDLLGDEDLLARLAEAEREANDATGSQFGPFARMDRDAAEEEARERGLVPARDEKPSVSSIANVPLAFTMYGPVVSLPSADLDPFAYGDWRHPDVAPWRVKLARWLGHVVAWLDDQRYRIDPDVGPLW